MRFHALAVFALMASVTACGGAAVDAPDSANPAAGSTVTTTTPARRPSPPGAVAYFIEPRDGAVVDSPVRVVFGLSGMGVAPAGTERDNTGHHHLLIDTTLPDPGTPIPANDRHLHFGGGQTETTIELAPGAHTLRLLLGDERHIPHDPPVMSAEIAIEVR